MVVEQISEDLFNISVNVESVDIILNLDNGNKTELLNLSPDILRDLNDKITIALKEKRKEQFVTKNNM